MALSIQLINSCIFVGCVVFILVNCFQFNLYFMCLKNHRGRQDTPVDLQQETTLTREATQDETRNEGDASWPHAAVVLLLETFRVNRHLFTVPTLKKVDVWRKISQQITANGCTYSATACQKKWDNMRNRYKIITERHKNTGQSRKKWEYMKIMADLLPAAQPDTPPLPASAQSEVKKAVTAGAEGASNTKQLQSRSVSVQTAPAGRDTVLLPSSKLKRLRRQKQLPHWFKEYEQRNRALIEKLIQVTETRNDLLKELIQKL